MSADPIGTAVPPQRTAVSAAMAEVWVRHRPEVIEHIRLIGHWAGRLGGPGVDAEEWATMRRHVHDQAGSLGIFGLDHAASLAKELDERLRHMDRLEPGDTTDLVGLVAELRRAVQPGSP